MAIAIVLAAGAGSRMNSSTPKQFMKLNDKEIICYSLDIFQTDSDVTDIILVTGQDYVSYCQKNIVEVNGYTKVRAVVAGGKERYNSVYNGIIQAEKIFADNAVKNRASVMYVDVSDGTENVVSDIQCGCDGKTAPNVVIIHDGARPFITHRMISDSIACIKSGFVGCTVAVPVKDTIKIVKRSGDYVIGEETPDRSTVYQIQTPQTFICEELHRAYDRMFVDENHNITDDTMLLERYLGLPCALVNGSYENIKITTPEDLLIGKSFAEKQENIQ
jgi:2-C-methyl-D-erythritol 4-phosphate cytidylyltransferase